MYRTNGSGRSEIRSLTGLRGVAAVLVVFHHFLLGPQSSNPIRTFVMHGYLAVDIFFVLSGFVMALSYRHMFSDGFSRRSYTTFLGRRIARVYPLYLVCTLCVFLLMYTGILPFPLEHTGSVWTLLVQNVLLIQTWGLNASLDGPGWSISAEWAAYLIFPLLLIPTLLRKSWMAWVTGVLAFVAVAVISFLPETLLHRGPPGAPLGLAGPTFAVPVFRCIAEFTLGLLAFRTLKSRAGIFLTSHQWAATTICCVMLALMCIPKTDLAVVALVPFLIISIAAGDQLPARMLAARPLEYLGRISYSIYLVHGPFGALIVDRLAKYLASRGMTHTQMIGAVAGISAAGLVSVFAYKVIEVPGRHWVRRVLEGPRAERPAARAADLRAEPGEF